MTLVSDARTPLTLAELARAPERVTHLAPSAIPALMAQAAALQAALATRLASGSAAPEPPRDHRVDTERLLTPPEAAAVLGVTVSWLYRHAGRLPFARRLSRKALRFSEAGLQRWIAARRA